MSPYPSPLASCPFNQLFVGANRNKVVGAFCVGTESRYGNLDVDGEAMSRLVVVVMTA